MDDKFKSKYQTIIFDLIKYDVKIIVITFEKYIYTYRISKICIINVAVVLFSLFKKHQLCKRS